MDSNLMNQVINLATKAAIAAYKEEQTKEQQLLQDRRLRNTKLLLKNFKNLKSHTELINSQLIELDKEIVYDFYNNEISIESIKRSKKRTLLMISLVSAMMDVYSRINPSRYELLQRLYIAEDKATVSTLAKERFICERQLYKELAAAIEQLSILLFGVDSLQLV